MTPGIKITETIQQDPTTWWALVRISTGGYVVGLGLGSLEGHRYDSYSADIYNGPSLVEARRAYEAQVEKAKGVRY